MQTALAKSLIELEKKFWRTMIDQDTDTALSMLEEPALMVSGHGAMKFDHAQYRQMAEQGSLVVKDYDLSDFEVMFPSDDTALITYRVKQSVAPRGKSDAMVQEMSDSSVWVRKGEQWLCVMHTETPRESAR